MQEYVTVRGKKMIAIPIEELQFVELKTSYFPRDFWNEPDGNEAYAKWCSRVYEILKGKYGTDAEEQLGFRRFPSIFNGKKIPERHFQDLLEKMKQIPTDDFRNGQDDFIKSICEKYGIKYFEEYK